MKFGMAMEKNEEIKSIFILLAFVCKALCGKYNNRIVLNVKLTLSSISSAP